MSPICAPESFLDIMGNWLTGVSGNNQPWEGDAMTGNKVLVVDDEPFILRSLTFVLRREGFDVSEARDGEEACAKYEELKPELVTMDLIMPKMGGLDALKEICQKDPNAKVVVISKYDA